MAKAKRKLSAYNLYMKRELKGKMKGKTKAQRLAIFKAAARGWKKKSKPRSKPRSASRSRSVSRRSSTTRRSNTRMGNKGGFNTAKLFKWVRIGALLMPAGVAILGPGSIEEKGKRVAHKYTGVNPNDGTFRWEYAFETYKPFIFATIITAVVPKITSFIRSLMR